jgi:hypothetical protein
MEERSNHLVLPCSPPLTQDSIKWRQGSFMETSRSNSARHGRTRMVGERDAFHRIRCPGVGGNQVGVHRLGPTMRSALGAWHLPRPS